MASGGLFPDIDYDDDFDEPLPPSQAEIDLGYRVAEVRNYLDHASYEHDRPFALDMAVRVLMRFAPDRKGLRPDAEDRDRMLEAAARARIGATQCLAWRYPQKQIDIGMDAICGMIVHWAASDAEREARPSDFKVDMFAYAKMFRRDLSNVLTLDGIRERARARRAREITAPDNSFLKVEVLR